MEGCERKRPKWKGVKGRDQVEGCERKRPKWKGVKETPKWKGERANAGCVI